MNDSSTSASIPVREDGAERILAAVTDPVTRNLMVLCLAEARMRFMKWQDQTQEEREQELPVASFDMEFLASVLRKVFSRQETIQKILNGESLEAATGWETP